MPHLDTVDFPAEKHVDAAAIPMPVKLDSATRDLPREELIALAGQVLGFMDDIAAIFEPREADRGE